MKSFAAALREFHPLAGYFAAGACAAVLVLLILLALVPFFPAFLALVIDAGSMAAVLTLLAGVAFGARNLCRRPPALTGRGR